MRQLARKSNEKFTIKNESLLKWTLHLFGLIYFNDCATKDVAIYVIQWLYTISISMNLIIIISLCGTWSSLRITGRTVCTCKYMLYTELQTKMCWDFWMNARFFVTFESNRRWISKRTNKLCWILVNLEMFCFSCEWHYFLGWLLLTLPNRWFLLS